MLSAALTTGLPGKSLRHFKGWSNVTQSGEFFFTNLQPWGSYQLAVLEMMTSPYFCEWPAFYSRSWGIWQSKLCWPFLQCCIVFLLSYLTCSGFWLWLCSVIREGKGNAPHSSTLAWEIPWTEEPGGLQSMGSWRVRHFHALEKAMATHSSVLAWRIPGTGAWWAAVYGVAQSRTWLTWLSSSSSMQCHTSSCSMMEDRHGDSREAQRGRLQVRGGQSRNSEETPSFLSPPSPLPRSHLLSACYITSQHEGWIWVW